VAKQQSDTPADDGQPSDGVKGRPTPKRREAEAANKRPLVASDRKRATKSDKSKQRAQRAKAQQAMMAGDERYLPARDRGPVRRYVRDYVDARWNMAEWFLPASFVIVAVVLFAGSNPRLGITAVLVLYALVLLAVGDAIFATRVVKRRVIAKFGQCPKGTLWYTAMRAFQIRPTRVPRPRVKRGQYPS
jgi:hypothetical protein